MKTIDDNIGAIGWKAFIFFMLFLSAGQTGALGQCKSFKLTDRGDTINCIDQQGVKQGPWLESMPTIRGNPGYEEEGVYIDGKKDGTWRRYSLQGDIMAVETYKWGLLNGKCQYYSIFGLEREESWWAIDPGKKFDTLEVPDLYVEGNFRTVIVPNEGRSMKHGSWNFYNSQTGRIERSEEYIRDSAVGILGAMGISSKKAQPKETGDSSTPKKVEKPSVVQEWEKKNAGKKKVVVRDGSTGY